MSFNTSTRTLSFDEDAITAGSGTLRIRATNSEGTDDWTVAYTFAVPDPLDTTGSLTGDLDGSIAGVASLGSAPAPNPLDATGTLTGDLAGSIEGAASLGGVPLTLADRVVPSETDLVFAALIEAGVNEITRYQYDGAGDADNIGTILDGDTQITSTLAFEWLRGGGTGCIFNRRTTTDSFEDQFESGMPLRGATLYLQDSSGVASFLIADVEDDRIGGGFMTVLDTVPGAQEFCDKLRALGDGDRFILSMTTSLIPLDATGTITGDLAGSIEGSASLGDEPLMLAAWSTPAGEIDFILALLPATISGDEITVDPVTPIGGDLVVASNLTIHGLLRTGGGENVRLVSTGGGGFSNYFDDEGTPRYPDAKLYIQTDADTVIPFTIGATGFTFNNWSIDDSGQVGAINGIGTGDRFILAITNPPFVDATGEITGVLSGAIEGVASLGDAPVVDATGALTGGLTGSIQGEASFPPISTVGCCRRADWSHCRVNHRRRIFGRLAGARSRGCSERWLGRLYRGRGIAWGSAAP